jgi:topoisomerase IA-like protein
MVGIKTDISNMSNEELISLAKELNNDSNTFIIGKTKVYVKNGDNGPYLMLPHGTKKPTFISIPKNIDHTNITATQIKEIIEKNKKFKKQV